MEDRDILQKEVYGMTTSPLPTIRMIYFMVAMILYNLWQLINTILSVDRRVGEIYRVTLPFMITVLCAQMNKGLNHHESQRR